MLSSAYLGVRPQGGSLIVIAKYLTLLGMILSVAWLLWNPEGWTFEWEPVVVFTLTLAGFVGTDLHLSKPKANGLNAHDADLFSLFKIELANHDTIEFLKNHDFLGAFKIEEISDLNKFTATWDNATHEFVDQSLETIRKTLYESVSKFCIAIGRLTSPNEMGNQSVVVNELKHIEEHWLRFQKEANELNLLADSVVNNIQALLRAGHAKVA